MDSLDRTDWDILDATADDWENLEQIYLAVCFELSGKESSSCCYRRARRDIVLEEVADRIRGLVDRGLLAAVNGEDGRPVTDPKDLSYVWKAWFGMTPQGRSIWESSEQGELLE